MSGFKLRMYLYREMDQMTLNEYIDPFTGEPVQKSKK